MLCSVQDPAAARTWRKYSLFIDAGLCVNFDVHFSALGLSYPYDIITIENPARLRIFAHRDPSQL